MSDAMEAAGHVISRLEHGKVGAGYRSLAEAVVLEWLDTRLSDLSTRGRITIDKCNLQTQELRRVLLEDWVP